MRAHLNPIKVELSSEVLQRLQSEQAVNRLSSNSNVVFVPRVKREELADLNIALKDGYEKMGQLNSYFSELGLGGDVCCLEDYEENLRDDVNGKQYEF